MKTRKIMTKKAKQIVISDIVTFIFCIIVTEVRLKYENNIGLISTCRMWWQVLKYLNPAPAILISIAIFLLYVLFKSWLIIVIYVPYRMARKKVIEENRRYQVIENIEYYREKFEDISPAEMSMIADLEVETKKDISATILKLYSKKIIDFEGDKIVFKEDANTDGLKVTEREIMEFIREGELETFNRNTWKELGIREAITDGYIQRKGTRKKKHFWIITLIILALIFLMVYDVRYITSDESRQLFNEMEIDAEIQEQRNIEAFGEDYENVSDEEELAYYNEHPELLEELASLMVKYKKVIFCTLSLVFGVPIIIILLIYKKVRKVTYKAVEAGNNYERTKTGEILAEQIAAMQRYIHEFSLLSEREKEEIKLWDDFLVYAVVLEENEDIIDDVFKYKNVKKEKFL